MLRIANSDVIQRGLFIVPMMEMNCTKDLTFCNYYQYLAGLNCLF